MRKGNKTFRYIAYSLEILIIFVLQTTPELLPEIAGSKPVLLLPLALSFAFFEEEAPSVIFAVVCGMFLDLSISNNVGFYSLLLPIICYVISMIFKDFMVVNFVNSLAISAGIIAITLILYFLIFRVAVQGIGEPFYYFVNHYISRIIYTVVFVPVFYFLNKFLYKNLRN